MALALREGPVFVGVKRFERGAQALVREERACQGQGHLLTFVHIEPLHCRTPRQVEAGQAVAFHIEHVQRGAAFELERLQAVVVGVELLEVRKAVEVEVGDEVVGDVERDEFAAFREVDGRQVVARHIEAFQVREGVDACKVDDAQVREVQARDVRDFLGGDATVAVFVAGDERRAQGCVGKRRRVERDARGHHVCKMVGKRAGSRDDGHAERGQGHGDAARHRLFCRGGARHDVGHAPGSAHVAGGPAERGRVCGVVGVNQERSQLV